MKKLFSLVLMLGLMAGLPFPASAGTVTTTTTTIRTDAPFYYGPVDAVLLEPLALEDFQRFGTKPPAAFEQYQQYKQDLDNVSPDSHPKLYKMTVERELTVADFSGPGISPDLAQARYEDYKGSEPVELNGRKVRYVYVYHTMI